MASLLAIALLAITAVSALTVRQSITPLSTSQIDYFTPYTYLASAGYCTAAQTLAWNCGTNCKANSDFKPVASGGDGSDVQYWYVGYSPSLDTVIVAHQGTDPAEILPLITDGDIVLTNLDPSLFPGISSDIEVHSGFKNAQASTATAVLSAVQTAMSKYESTDVTMVGHSLGAAISLLDSVYLPLHLPAGTSFKTIGYGLPRVGNQAFADYVDAHLHLTHINNEEDPIPTCPGMFLGFVHPAGEVHIQDSGEWSACPGQDNPSTQCIVGDVPYIWDGDESDHNGPYNGIEMGSELVTAQQNITFLTTSQIDFFTPYTWYASTAYCAPQQTAIWNCGANCDANPHFNPVASGGDGIEVQYWYVGYDPILQTVIVAHQGTIVNNVSAKEVLAAVERTMSQYNCTSVTIVGHSLGGAIALIDSVYLPLWLPQDISFTTITYGLPRVGNPAFAAYVDAHTNLTHVNNKYDPVPTVPPQFTGYAHPNGEVHIEEGDWAVCPDV
ncbi:hypothetical protein ID866_7058 [Astraeus odoratus]|nr:hypothetical protein ID866_7058 [Astraeus odoratus]